MKVILFLTVLFPSLFITPLIPAMVTRSKKRSGFPEFVSYVKQRQNWKKKTCEFLQNNPEDEDAQILNRYLYRMADNVKRFQKSQNEKLLALAQKQNFAFENGYDDLHYVITGEELEGPIAAIAYGEGYWLKELAEVEARIAQK